MIRFVPITLAALTLVLSTGCGSSSTTPSGNPDSLAVDTIVKVEMNADAFPVNQIPDDHFGKTLEQTSQPNLKVEAQPLPTLPEKAPDWLEAIVSRESIVAFGKLMATAPEEIEFVQEQSIIYEAQDHWQAFAVHFKTRPSNMGILVFGAYIDEQHTYWHSISRKGPITFTPTKVTPAETSVTLQGRMTTDTGSEAPFSIELHKDSGKLTTGKTN